MRSFIVFLVILFVVGAAGAAIIVYFDLPRMVAVVFGVILLAALLLSLFGGPGGFTWPKPGE